MAIALPPKGTPTQPRRTTANWHTDRPGDLSRLDGICHNSRGLIDPDGSKVLSCGRLIFPSCDLEAINLSDAQFGGRPCLQGSHPGGEPCTVDALVDR
jgi:hypothetical protein